MNVIVANERRVELNSLNIDIIKNVEGLYTVDELIGMFTNFFFNKIIIDVTAIKDYSDYRNIKKLFEVIDTKKAIILLNENNNLTTSKEYISDLITLGVYNFTADINQVMELYNKSRDFADVSDLQIKKTTFDINSEIDKANGVNQKEDFTFADFVLPGEYDGDKKIIGVKNLTEHAGATTLVVQMVKQLNAKYKAIGIEMNKQDFIYFKTPNIYSCTSDADVLRKIKEHQDVDAVIVDLNNYNHQGFCTDIIYLIEPGIIRMTKLIKRNSKIFEELSGQKIILNRTNMDDSQVSEFEVEINAKMFSVVSNFRDNLDRVISVDKLLNKLGYTKCAEEVIVDSEPVRKKIGLFGKRK